MIVFCKEQSRDVSNNVWWGKTFEALCKCIWRMQGTRTCKTYEHAFQFQDILFLWATRGQHSGQFIGSAEVCASLLSTKWSAIGFFWLIFVFFVAFDVYLYVRDRDGFMWSSCRHFVCFTMVECTRLLFDVSWGGVHSSRALDAAQGMFHMDSSEFPYRQFSSRDLTEEDKVWGSRKKGGRREGLYESSRAVNMVDGLPRAPSWVQDGVSKIGANGSEKWRYLRICEFVWHGSNFPP